MVGLVESIAPPTNNQLDKLHSVCAEYRPSVSWKHLDEFTWLMSHEMQPVSLQSFALRLALIS